MTDPRPTFDLVSEPWIPCVESSGRVVELGLRDVIGRAHELRAVADPSPLATFALHRLLLALVHRVVEGPGTVADWRHIWEAGRFDAARLDAYFERWRDRFDLFHERWPFYQTAGFAVVGKDKAPVAPSPATRLLPELATGNNTTLFDHSVEAVPTPLSPSAAARAVVVAQTWGLGGGKGPRSNLFDEHPYLSHAPCVGAVAVLLTDTTLYRTLTLNLARIGPEEATPFRSGPSDAPAWERDTHTRWPQVTSTEGYLDSLTWPARHLRLLPAGGGMIAAMYIAQGPVGSEQARQDNPFAFYRTHEKLGRLPVALGQDRAVWRDSSALFAMPRGSFLDGRPQALRFCVERKVRATLGDRAHLGLVCYGLASDKAKPLAWRREEIPAPIRLLEDRALTVELEAGLTAVEAVWQALRSAARKLAYETLATPDKSPDSREVTRLQDRLVAHLGFWEAMDAEFHAFLRDLGPDARRIWVKRAARVAENGLVRASGFSEGSVARSGRAVALAQQNLRLALAALPELRTAPKEEPTTPSQKEAS